jgi:hypothetical protein
MKNFVILNNNKVVNIVVGESKEIVESVVGPGCIELQEDSFVTMGDDYDAETNTFSRPINIEEVITES